MGVKISESLRASPCPRTLLWSATGPRSQRLRHPARAGNLPKAPIAFGPAARRDVARSGRRRVQGRKALTKFGDSLLGERAGVRASVSPVPFFGVGGSDSKQWKLHLLPLPV